MDALAVKQACKFAKEHALKNGPIVSFLSSKYIMVANLCVLKNEPSFAKEHVFKEGPCYFVHDGLILFGGLSPLSVPRLFFHSLNIYYCFL